MTTSKKANTTPHVIESAENHLNVVRLTLMRALEEVGRYQKSIGLSAI